MKKFVAGLLSFTLAVGAVGSCQVLAEEAEVRDWKSYDLSGEITIYTPIQEQQIKITEDLFYEAYPDVTLNFVTESTGVLLTRLGAEAENVQADVMLAGLTPLNGDAYYEYFQPYTNIYADECEYSDGDGYYNYYNVNLSSIYTNPDLEAELGFEVSSYQDLIRPELKGKLVILDPKASSSMFLTLVTLLYGIGDGDVTSDAAWDYVEQMMVNMDGSYAPGNILTLVDTEEYIASVFSESDVLASIADGMNLRMITPEYNQPVYVATAMVKDCPNPEGAKAFIDFICSADYQNALAQELTGFRPANVNCELPDDLTPLSEMNLVYPDYDDVIENTQYIYDRWDEIWTKLYN